MRLIYILLLVLFASCTVTKRVHRPGYHVEWKKQNKDAKSLAAAELKKDKKLRRLTISDSLSLDTTPVSTIETVDVLEVNKAEKDPETFEASSVEAEVKPKSYLKKHIDFKSFLPERTTSARSSTTKSEKRNSKADPNRQSTRGDGWMEVGKVMLVGGLLILLASVFFLIFGFDGGSSFGSLFDSANEFTIIILIILIVLAVLIYFTIGFYAGVFVSLILSGLGLIMMAIGALINKRY